MLELYRSFDFGIVYVDKEKSFSLFRSFLNFICVFVFVIFTEATKYFEMLVGLKQLSSNGTVYRKNTDLAQIESTGKME